MKQIHKEMTSGSKLAKIQDKVDKWISKPKLDESFFKKCPLQKKNETTCYLFAVNSSLCLKLDRWGQGNQSYISW